MPLLNKNQLAAVIAVTGDTFEELGRNMDATIAMADFTQEVIDITEVTCEVYVVLDHDNNHAVQQVSFIPIGRLHVRRGDWEFTTPTEDLTEINIEYRDSDETREEDR